MQQLGRALMSWWHALADLLERVKGGIGAWLRQALKWWWVLVVVFLTMGIGVGVLIRRGASQKDNLQVFTVERGNVVASVTATGEVYAPRGAELSFDVNKIPLIELNAIPGRQVKAGEVLARIDPTILKRAVTQAEADLTVAQDALEQAQNPYTALDLAQARLAVGQAEVALEDAKKNLEKTRDPYGELDVMQARLSVSQTQAALMDAQKNLDALLTPDTVAAHNAARDAAAALKSAQSQLVVTQNDPDNVARLRTLEYEANWYRNNYWESLEKFKRGEINQQKLDYEYSNMLGAAEKLKTAQVKAESTLASAQSQATKAQETYDKALADLAKLQSGPDALASVQARNQVAQADYNLAKARADLTKIEAGPDPLEATRAQNQVSQAEYNLAKARADLAKIEAGPDPKAVRVAQAKVAAAQAILEEAQAALKAATMTAPFGGTVISVGAAVGDLISSSLIVVTLADLSNLRVRAIVDETEISQVEIGQEVTITFDAFPGRRFRGKVLEVPLQGKLTQNILTYEVPVSLEGVAGVALKPGTTANLSIVVGRRQNVVLVPVLAVQRGEETNVVRVQSPQGAPVETQVTLGLSDGMYVEVTRGLSQGERVLVEYQTSQTSAAGSRNVGPGAPNPASIIPGGGGRGGR